MKELQEDIGAWQTETFKQTNVPSLLKHLEREMVELKGIGNRFVSHCGKRDGSFDLTQGICQADHVEMLIDFKHEIADVIILSIAIADLINIDLNDAVEEKMVINKARTWKAPDDDGVVEHA